MTSPWTPSATIIDDVASTNPHYDDLETNASAVTVTESNGTYTIAGDLEDCATFASTDINMGSHAWLAIDIDTTVPDITKVSVDGTPCKTSQATLATKYGLDAGHFIKWIALDELADDADGISMTLSTENNPNVTFTFVFESTAVADDTPDAET